VILAEPVTAPEWGQNFPFPDKVAYEVGTIQKKGWTAVRESLKGKRHSAPHGTGRLHQVDGVSILAHDGHIALR
jgi:hypothetical protein